MEQQQNLDPENSMGRLMGQIGKAMTKSINARFKELGIPINLDQWIVLVHLWQEDGQNQAQLGETAGHNKTTVTRAIDTLEKRNLVLRIPDKQDRRNKLIYLTNQGKDMQDKLTPIALEIHTQAVKGISDSDLETCKSVLRRMYQNLKVDI
ncbi:MAG: MarR family transcriptional regulator [Bacteroidota bacterium]